MLMRRVHHNAGFTLLEMVVTITIFSILVALTVPTMRVWICNAKVRAVADALQNGVRLSQTESLRRSRQVVFALTNSTTPQTGTFTATTNGNYWAIMTIPAMTDGSESAAFVQSGVLSSTSANVQITGPAEICFNSVGRLVANTSTGVAGGSCSAPTVGTPPRLTYVITLAGADHSLQVEVAQGGQVHLCDPLQTLSSTNPYGCYP
jgi:type IV fimbrial biogenesis protein FimT